MGNYRSSIDNEIGWKERRRSFQTYRNRARNALGRCQDCGKPIYQTDKDGEPYRLCYGCSRGTFTGK